MRFAKIETAQVFANAYHIITVIHRKCVGKSAISVVIVFRITHAFKINAQMHVQMRVERILNV